VFIDCVTIVIPTKPEPRHPPLTWWIQNKIVFIITVIKEEVYNFFKMCYLTEIININLVRMSRL